MRSVKPAEKAAIAAIITATLELAGLGLMITAAWLAGLVAGLAVTGAALLAVSWAVNRRTSR
jgi:hypothetical protein